MPPESCRRNRGVVVPRPSGDEGFALPLALFSVVIFLALAAVMAMTAMNATGFTGSSRNMEGAVHAAEAAADRVLTRVAAASGYTTGHVYNPASGSTADQRAWALAQRASTPAVDVPGGTAYAIRPTNAGVPMNVIFGVGFAGSGANEKVRVIKFSFTSGTYSPPFALATGQPLSISGNPTFAGAGSRVHSNGSLSISGSVSTSGALTAVGTCTGCSSYGAGSGASKPVEALPTISASSLYAMSSDYAGTVTSPYNGNWYDLCPNGAVRKPGATPCTGTILWNVSGGVYRGWQLSGNDWVLGNDDRYDGIYYIHQKNVKIGGNVPGKSGAPASVTMLVAANPTGAGGASGNFSISGNPRLQPFLPSMLVMADRDVEMSGNPETSGFIGAHEQLKISGNMQHTGAIIAEGAPHTSGSPVALADQMISGNPRITYDSTLELPFTSLLRVAGWTEL